jgi:hypothetical protein
MIRLASVNVEVSRILAELEPLLHRIGVIEGVTEISRRYGSIGNRDARLACLLERVEGPRRRRA